MSPALQLLCIGVGLGCAALLVSWIVGCIAEAVLRMASEDDL